ncbi:MAG: EamA family transporter [Desulfovibrionaceae bacterium]
MTWLVLALLTALFSATEAAALKRFFGDLPGLQMGAALLLYSLPMFAAGWLLTPDPGVGRAFWIAIALTLPANALGFTLHMLAINVSPLSLTMPFLAFTPAFVLLTGFVFLGEVPSLLGASGIGLIIAGSYVLNISEAGMRDWMEPFRAVLRERGSMYMLAAALAYAFAAVLGKRIILASENSPLYAAMALFTIYNAAFLLAARLAGRISIRGLLSRPRAGTLVGAVLFTHVLCHFSAIALTHAAYMIAIKRLNGLFSVLYGGWLFKEGRMGQRLAGAAFMALGAAAVALAG